MYAEDKLDELYSSHGRLFYQSPGASKQGKSSYGREILHHLTKAVLMTVPYLTTRQELEIGTHLQDSIWGEGDLELSGRLARSLWVVSRRVWVGEIPFV